jgi:hypothetical protein
LSRGRSSSHQNVARNLLRKDFTERFTERLAGTFTDRASLPPVTPQGRAWRFRPVWRLGLPPAGTAGSDSGKATTPSRVMRRGPFHHHHQPARLPNCLRPSTPHHPAERRLVVPIATLANRRPTRASFARAYVATGCTANQLKFAPDKNLFSARARGGQRGMKNRSVMANLTLSGTREPFRASGQARGPRV